METRRKGLVSVLVTAGLLLLLLLVAVLRRGEREKVAPHSDPVALAPKGDAKSHAAAKKEDRLLDAPTNGPKPQSTPTDQQVEKWIHGLFPKHTKARLAQTGFQLSGFAAAKVLHYREARLAANAFPEVTERVAMAVVLDPNADWVERVYAVGMLQNVYKGGKSSAAAVLQSLSNDPDPRVANVALAALGDADLEGLNRGLYWEKCKTGSITAYLVVSHYSDAGTAGILEEILATGRSFYAQEALDRVRTLQSNDWEGKLGTILKPARPAESDATAAIWALKVVARKPTPYLLQVLRSRLDDGLASAQETWKLGSLGVATTSFDDTMKKSPDFVNMTKDPHYDKTLVVYGQLGGTLSDLEKGRLRELGFLCDPKERLFELMSEEQ